jgi:hypothetical protein
MLLIFGVNVPPRAVFRSSRPEGTPKPSIYKNYLFGDAKLIKKGRHRLFFKQLFVAPPILAPTNPNSPPTTHNSL